MKNVLITGATGGIGQSLVKVFHANGYKICATGTNVEKLSFLEKKYEARFKGIQCDLSDDVQIKKLVEESKKFYGSFQEIVVKSEDLSLAIHLEPERKIKIGEKIKFCMDL